MGEYSNFFFQISNSMQKRLYVRHTLMYRNWVFSGVISLCRTQNSYSSVALCGIVENALVHFMRLHRTHHRINLMIWSISFLEHIAPELQTRGIHVWIWSVQSIASALSLYSFNKITNAFFYIILMGLFPLRPQMH